MHIVAYSLNVAVFAALAVTMHLKGGNNPPITAPFPDRIRVIHGSPESTTQTTSRSVQPFCTAHACVQQTQTDKQTTLNRYQ